MKHKFLVITLTLLILLSTLITALTINDVPTEDQIDCNDYNFICDLFADGTVNTTLWANTGTAVETGGYLQHNGARATQFGTASSLSENNDWCMMWKYNMATIGSNIESLSTNSYDYDSGQDSCISYRNSATSLGTLLHGGCTGNGWSPTPWTETAGGNYTMRICYTQNTDSLNLTVWENQTMKDSNKTGASITTSNLVWYEVGGDQRLLWAIGWNNTVINAPYTSSLTITPTYPLNDSTQNEYNGWINLTAASTLDDFHNCTNNNTAWVQNNYFNNGTNANMSWYNTNYATLPNAWYNINFSCTTNSSEERGYNLIFALDTVLPNITSTIQNNDTYWTYEQTLKINGTDIINLDTVNINDSCGFNYLNTSVLNPFLFDTTLNISKCALGNQHTNVSICDGINCRNKTFTWNNMGRVNVTVKSRLNGTSINTFSVYLNGTLNGNTTGGFYHVDNLTNALLYNVEVRTPGYETKDTNITVSTNLAWANFTVYSRNSFNFTFRDMDTQILITSNVTLNILGTTKQTNYTASGSLYLDILTPGDYAFVYKADLYRQNQYLTTLTNNSHQDINLYLVKENTTSLVLITVEDKFGTALESVEVTIQRYENNAWLTEQILSTDNQGRTEGQFVLSTVYYNFIIKYQGTVYFGSPNNDSNKKLIYAEDVTDGLKFTIDILGDNEYQDYLQTYDVIHTLEWINLTNQSDGYFRFHYDDINNNQWEACLEVLKGGDMTPICDCTNNTVTSESSTLICNINQTSGQAVYTAKSYIYQNNWVGLDTLVLKLGEPKTKQINWGATGYIFAFFIVLISFVIFLNVPAISLYVGTGMFCLLALLGVIFKDINFGILILLLVLTYFVANIKSEQGLNG